MMSNKNYDELSFTTRAIHAGTEPDPATGAIEPAVYMANSFLLPYDASQMNWSASEANIYTRNGGVSLTITCNGTETKLIVYLVN